MKNVIENEMVLCENPDFKKEVSDAKCNKCGNKLTEFESVYEKDDDYEYWGVRSKDHGCGEDSQINVVEKIKLPLSAIEKIEE